MRVHRLDQEGELAEVDPRLEAELAVVAPARLGARVLPRVVGETDVEELVRGIALDAQRLQEASAEPALEQDQQGCK